MTLAILVTHDELSLINAIGLVICLLGITLHVVLKVSINQVEIPLQKNIIILFPLGDENSSRVKDLVVDEEKTGC